MSRILLTLSSLASAVAISFGDLGAALRGKGKTFAPPVVMGTDEMMSQKAHGTSATPVQKDLRWSCKEDLADRICNYNRHCARAPRTDSRRLASDATADSCV